MFINDWNDHIEFVRQLFKVTRGDWLINWNNLQKSVITVSQKRLNLNGGDEGQTKLIPGNKNWDGNQIPEILWILARLQCNINEVYATRQFLDMLIRNSTIIFLNGTITIFYIFSIQLYHLISIFRPTKVDNNYFKPFSSESTKTARTFHKAIKKLNKIMPFKVFIKWISPLSVS